MSQGREEAQGDQLMERQEAADRLLRQPREGLTRIPPTLSQLTLCNLWGPTFWKPLLASL